MSVLILHPKEIQALWSLSYDTEIRLETLFNVMNAMPSYSVRQAQQKDASKPDTWKEKKINDKERNKRKEKRKKKTDVTS